MNRQKQSLKCVVLLDIDGTLLTGPDQGPSAGFKAMGQATRKLAGNLDAYDSVEFAGRTDEQIARSLLEATGEINPADRRVLEVVSCYLSFLESNVESAPYEILGHPEEAVAALRSCGAVVELGTGNIRAGAKIKLGNAKLDKLFDFDKGGFGDGAKTRADLLAKGAQKCDPTQKLPIVIIGDTPHDVHAAHEIGAICIGVPYRHNTSNILKEAGAHAIVNQIDVGIVDVIATCLKATR